MHYHNLEIHIINNHTNDSFLNSVIIIMLKIIWMMTMHKVTITLGFFPEEVLSLMNEHTQRHICTCCHTPKNHGHSCTDAKR